jgi:nitrogen-specific signal transduction histidine kinase
MRTFKKNSYLLHLLFLLFTMSMALFVCHLVVNHSVAITDFSFICLTTIYILVLVAFIFNLKRDKKIHQFRDIQKVINTITKKNGVQYTSYIVEKRRFVNLNKIGEGEYSDLPPETLYAMTHPADLNIVKEMVERMNSGKNESMNYEYRLKLSYSDKYVWRQVSIYPLSLNSDGTVNTYIGADLDNEKAHEMMNDMMLFSKKIMFITSHNSILFVQYDRSARKFLRLDDTGRELIHDIKMDFWTSHIYPFDKDVPMKMLEFMDKGQGDTYNAEYRYKYPNEYRWFSVNVAAYEKDEDGKILSYMCLVTDIDERKKALEKEIELHEQAVAANKLKTYFIENLSHEIRTPLNSIIGFSNLIDKDTSEEELSLYKNIINKNNEQLLNIIDYTLNRSLFESGFTSINHTSFMLKGLFEEKYKKYSREMKPGVELKYEYGTDVFIETDRDWVSKIIDELMKNAKSFTNSGSITIGYGLIKNEVKIFVKDTGIGIAEKDQNRIFENFEKVNSFAPGLGMGLSMCKAIVTRLGGTISVESELGKGSCFCIWLPH